MKITLAILRLSVRRKFFRCIALHSGADDLVSRCCPTFFGTTTGGAANESEKAVDASHHRCARSCAEGQASWRSLRSPDHSIHTAPVSRRQREAPVTGHLIPGPGDPISQQLTQEVQTDWLPRNSNTAFSGILVGVEYLCIPIHKIISFRKGVALALGKAPGPGTLPE
jgi:hypothetical protein